MTGTRTMKLSIVKDSNKHQNRVKDCKGEKGSNKDHAA